MFKAANSSFNGAATHESRKEVFNDGNRAASEQLQTRLQQVRAESGFLKGQNRAAGSAAFSYGLLPESQKRILDRAFEDGDLNEREARIVGRIAGLREGSPQLEAINKGGQNGIDAGRPGVAAFPGAMTSSELEKLTNQLKEAATKQSELENSLSDMVSTVTNHVANLQIEVLKNQQKIIKLEGSVISSTR